MYGGKGSVVGLSLYSFLQSSYHVPCASEGWEVVQNLFHPPCHPAWKQNYITLQVLKLNKNSQSTDGDIELTVVSVLGFAEHACRHPSSARPAWSSECDVRVNQSEYENLGEEGRTII